jgi:feruloyl esterase
MKARAFAAAIVLGAALQSVAMARHADAADAALLPVIKPVESCMALGNTDLRAVADTPTRIETATLADTPKGPFCEVKGTIAPAIRFEVDLPAEHWTQRYVEAGCGGLCGSMPEGLSNASGCAPALNGELALATDDMGHQSRMGAPDQGVFGADPQKRIDFAYRANHVTTLVAKALIRAFYGRAQKYSYFVGCSDGGREALMEAQRYPGDFDGIAAGDPAALLTVQNSFSGTWQQRANTRADNSYILRASKAVLIHDAVVAQCDTLSGVKDGVLQDPRACHFDPAELRCPAGAAGTSGCLTAEEVTALSKLYFGAVDDQGHHFTFGYQRGWEMRLPQEEQASEWSRGFAGQMVINLFLPTPSPAEGDKPFEFTEANLARMSALAPLYNATNTDLKPFAARGGKLILWHGWSDTLIPPEVSIAYYQGVQEFMGAAATGRFMRLYMLPGVGHCMGGDGYDQVDWLSALMSWVEKGHAPTAVSTGKTADRPSGPPGPRPAAAPRTPYARPAPTVVATRPVYPYPLIAHYTGKGDPNDAASYVAIRSPVPVPESFAMDAIRLIGPDNQKSYGVRDGRLVVLDDSQTRGTR